MPQDIGRPGDSSGLIRSLSGRSQIDPFIVMDVMRAAAAAEVEGRSIIHMEVGQPGTPAPLAARAAAARAIETDRLGYTLALGHPDLRARIAQHYAETYGVEVDAERVVVTSGSSAGFVLAFLSLFDVGDRVGVPVPGYPCYRQVLSALGVTPVDLRTGPDTRWMPSADGIKALAATAPLAGMMIASPNNPTGTMVDRARLEELVRATENLGAWFISDEIYHGLCYGQPETTALSVSDRVIIINSFSKYFSMTGWRVGWMVVPEAMVGTVEKLAQNLFIAAPAVSQVAALAAFDARPELEENRARYASNRDRLLKGLREIGLDRIVPADGAFYVYVDVSAYTNDSLAFSRQMLDEAGVACTPGLDFDAEQGGTFIRFSYAGSDADVSACLERLAGWQRLQASS